MLLILIFILSCNPDKQTKVDPNEITFATDDASVLFFKNVRQLYYEMEEMEAAKLKIFRHKKRDQSQDEPIINLAIVKIGGLMRLIYCSSPMRLSLASMSSR